MGNLHLIGKLVGLVANVIVGAVIDHICEDG